MNDDWHVKQAKLLVCSKIIPIKRPCSTLTLQCIPSQLSG
jgi:hypothetical protein